MALIAPAAARAERKRLLVVGAGPAGLAAAITAKKEATAGGHDLEVVVFESRARAGTRVNMIGLTSQTLDNLSWLGARLENGKTVQFLDRRTRVPESGPAKPGRTLPPVRLRPAKVSTSARAVLRQKNAATMPINGIEAELRREAAALGIVVKYRTAALDLRDVDGGVELTVNDGKKTRNERGWMVVMAHGGDKLSAHRTDAPERPQSEPKPAEVPSLLAKIGVVPRTDETIGSRLVARNFQHTGEREIRMRFESVAGIPGRKTRHMRLDGPDRSGTTALLSELPPQGDVDIDDWSLQQARAVGIATDPVGPGQEVYVALTSARSASDPSRRIAVVMGKGATGAKLLVGESLRHSQPHTGKAAQIAVTDGIDAGKTIAALLSAGGDAGKERALLHRYERARVRATAALQRFALAVYRESGVEPFRAPKKSGPRLRSVRKLGELRARTTRRRPQSVKGQSSRRVAGSRSAGRGMR